MMKSLLSFAIFYAAMLFSASAQADNIKVVYHLSEGVAQAARAMDNIRFHLAADPNVKIVVVAHGSGVDFMLEGASTQTGRAFVGTISDLAAQGVLFRVCTNTLEAFNISRDRLAMEATEVRSGVAEVARLQAKEGFVYLRP